MAILIIKMSISVVHHH